MSVPQKIGAGLFVVYPAPLFKHSAAGVVKIDIAKVERVDEVAYILWNSNNKSDYF